MSILGFLFAVLFQWTCFKTNVAYGHRCTTSADCDHHVNAVCCFDGLQGYCCEEPEHDDDKDEGLSMMTILLWSIGCLGLFSMILCFYLCHKQCTRKPNRRTVPTEARPRREFVGATNLVILQTTSRHGSRSLPGFVERTDTLPPAYSSVVDDNAYSYSSPPPYTPKKEG